MRFSRALVFATATLPLMLPLVAHATAIPFFGQIVPTEAQTCAAGFGAFAQVVNNIIAFAITIGIVFVAPLSIAYGGFLYVVNPVNPSGRAKANKILLNTIVGIVIALAAWLIVDVVLTVLTVTDTKTEGSVDYWSGKLFGDGSAEDCLLTDAQISNEALNQAPATGPGPTTGSCPEGYTQNGSSCTSCNEGDTECSYTLPYGSSCSGGGTFVSTTGQCQVCTEGDEGGCTTSSPVSTYATNTGTYGVSGAQCASDNTACSVSSLESAGYSSSQANTMSCIAVIESTGNPNTLPYNIAHPTSNSTACGTFQIVQTTWKAYASGSCTDFSNCTSAKCNTETALTMISKNGYKDYTCATCNSKAQGCIDKYK